MTQTNAGITSRPPGMRPIKGAMLYMCALSARRHNPVLKAFADRLKENGKAPKAILVAVARKLLVIAYGVLKTRKPFQPA
ncbi:hypothetical protein ABC728_10850 (plasmid) [Niveispirillum fermenti]